MLQAFSTRVQACVGSLTVPSESAEVIEAITLLKDLPIGEGDVITGDTAFGFRRPSIHLRRELKPMARSRSGDYDEKRANILKAAAVLFARLGFARTSISALAGACGFSKALVYHYYTSKEVLLFDLLDSYTTTFADAVLQAVGGEAGTVEERLRMAISCLMRICIADRERHIVMLNELYILPAAQRNRVVAAQNRVVNAIADLILEINPELGNGRDAKIPLAMSVLGMINWTYRWFRPEGSMTPDEFANMATDVFLNGIRGLKIKNAKPLISKRLKRSGLRPEKAFDTLT